MSPLISAEIVVGVLVLVVLGALVGIIVRRRTLAARGPLMLCGLRRGTPRFRLGLLLLGPDRLLWHSLFGVTLRPTHVWDRNRLDVETPEILTELIAGLPEGIQMRCHHEGDSFDLALSPAAYTATRSWLESSPPGFNVNVA